MAIGRSIPTAILGQSILYKHAVSTCYWKGKATGTGNRKENGNGNRNRNRNRNRTINRMVFSCYFYTIISKDPVSYYLYAVVGKDRF